MSAFDNLFQVLSGDDDFEEIPVSLDEFMSNDMYLGQLGMSLSPLQKKIIEASVEIYKDETLIKLYGEEEGKARAKRRYNELGFMLGKGCQDYNDEVYDPTNGTWNRIGDLQTRPINNVVSFDKENKCVSEDATESWMEGVGELFTVKTQQGYESTFNENHKVLARKINGTESKFIPLSELEIGDYVASPLNLPVVNEIEFDESEIIDEAVHLRLNPTEEFPEEIFSLSDRQLKLFLPVLLGIKVKDMETRINREFLSPSKEIAQDVQKLFARIGIPSTLSKDENLYKLIVNFEVEVNGDIYWDKIVSIESVGERPFYTLTAMDNHNYVSNGMIHANSGKNECTSIIVCYVVYKLLCLKDPAKYYGKPKNDHIDIINVAINSDQAKRNFFDNVVGKIKISPWFLGKYDAVAKEIKFDKNIHVYSGHSKAESFEGYNLIMAILDEIAGFGIDEEGGGSADDLYRMFSDSVTSRYSKYGKTIMLSFPRQKGDFIDTYYNNAIAQKETEIKKHLFKIDNDLPDGIKDNEFLIEWEEDHIISYKLPNVFCMRRPSWVINPTKDVEEYKLIFLTRPAEAYGKFAAMPPDSVDSYFGRKDLLEKSFRLNRLMVDENGVFAKSFQPKPGTKYYMHVDLGQVQDRAAVAMCHVDSWQQRTNDKFGDEYLVKPEIVVDFVRYWTPTKEQIIDITEVKNFIFQVIGMGFDVGLVTFDQWHSVDIIQELNGMGVKSEKLSLKKAHYDDFKLAVFEQRIVGPHIPILIDELIKLRVTKSGKVDHPLGGHNDMAEAITGAVYNATAYTERYTDENIKVVTMDDLRRQMREERRSQLESLKERKVIVAPGKTIPKDIEEYLQSIKVI